MFLLYGRVQPRCCRLPLATAASRRLAFCMRSYECAHAVARARVLYSRRQTRTQREANKPSHLGFRHQIMKPDQCGSQGGNPKQSKTEMCHGDVSNEPKPCNHPILRTLCLSTPLTACVSATTPLHPPHLSAHPVPTSAISWPPNAKNKLSCAHIPISDVRLITEINITAAHSCSLHTNRSNVPSSVA